MNADLAGARAPLDARSAPSVDATTPSFPHQPLVARRRARPAAFAPVLLLACALGGISPAWPQSTSADPREMTVEQLEAFIAEQKAALEIVRENRDITAEKAREVNAALEAKAAEREASAAELEVLCEERESLEPGSFDDCMATLGEE